MSTDDTTPETNGDGDGSVFSIDGRTFTCERPLSDTPVTGSYVQVATGDGRLLLGQVLHSSLGPAPTDPSRRIVIASGSLIGQIVDDEPIPIAPPRTFGSGSIEPADPHMVERHMRSTLGSSAGLELGELRFPAGVPALLKASGFGRHTFLCGQSGSGKTYTLGLILERLLLQTDIRISVLDPNSDYVSLSTLRDAADTGLDAEAYAALAADFAPVAERVHVVGGPEKQHQLRAWFGRLTIEQQTMVLGLDPFRDPGEYHAFIRTVADIVGDDYSVEDVLVETHRSFDDDARRLGRRIENLGVADLSIWASPDRPALLDQLPQDWRMIVADLGGLPSGREGAIASAAMLGFLWEQRRERQPIIIVIDEAHNVCPQNPVDENQALATEHVIRIAGEGRKFGLYLLLSTQRPDKVHQNVLSQCDNLLVMKMNSANDIRSLTETFSFAPGSLIERAPGFGLGEGLAAGKIAPDPLLFRSGRRFTMEGGSDVPSTWAQRSGR